MKNIVNWSILHNRTDQADSGAKRILYYEDEAIHHLKRCRSIFYEGEDFYIGHLGNIDFFRETIALRGAVIRKYHPNHQ